MEKLFRQVRHHIAEENFGALQSLPIAKPGYFNWVTEVFESINVKDHPDSLALVWTDGHKTEKFSFSQAAKYCNQLVNFLRKKNIGQQDVIFSQLPLLPANWICYLAAMKGGFRLIPAATILNVQDIIYRFDRLLPQVVIADEENAAKIDDAENSCGIKIALKIIVDGVKPGWNSWSDILSEQDIAHAALTKPDDPLFLFFTSGTTGMPKVVTHTQLSYPLGHLTTAAWIGLRKGDLHYNISQPGWAKFAWSSFFGPWNMGAGIFSFYQQGRFQVKEQLKIIEQYKITTLCAPPTVLRMFIQEKLTDYSFHFRACVAAGEPLNPEIIEAWKKGTGILIRDGYGQTETTCLVANLPGAKVKFGSMGKPTFLYDIVLAHDDGRECPILEEGNICIRTTNSKPNGVFSTYFGDPEKEKEVFRYGLYYTGDKAYLDEDGYIWFVGRDDDVIKASDYRIGPFEVESVLLEHPSVAESAVVGSPHPVRGNEIKAFIILAAGYVPDKKLADELFDYSKKNLAHYKMPRIIQFVSSLPKTISGKIRRVELRAEEAERKAKKQKPEMEYSFS
jgi:acetyl-CoA synthetase